jgi:hypothetical protein
LLAAREIADQAGDRFGVASAEAQLGELMAAIEIDDACSWFACAATGFREIGRSEGLAGVLRRLIEIEPDDQAARRAHDELREIARQGDFDQPLELEAAASLALGERLLARGNPDEALIALADAHSRSYRSVDGPGVVAAGLRLNAALALLHEAWPRFPTGESRRVEDAMGAAVDGGSPPASSEVMVGWELDPRNLPFTARHFPGEGTRNGWVLWTGTAPMSGPGYLPIRVRELLRWVPQVGPYLRLPPGWAFQIAPDHEDVWAEPELLED